VGVVVLQVTEAEPSSVIVVDVCLSHWSRNSSHLALG
jgi:hypothetical protein